MGYPRTLHQIDEGPGKTEVGFFDFADYLRTHQYMIASHRIPYFSRLTASCNASANHNVLVHDLLSFAEISSAMAVSLKERTILRNRVGTKKVVIQL